jgi:hypothetical protein
LFHRQGIQKTQEWLVAGGYVIIATV